MIKKDYKYIVIYKNIGMISQQGNACFKTIEEVEKFITNGDKAIIYIGEFKPLEVSLKEYETIIPIDKDKFKKIEIYQDKTNHNNIHNYVDIDGKKYKASIIQKRIIENQNLIIDEINKLKKGE